MTLVVSAGHDTPPHSRVIDLSKGPVPIGRASVKQGERAAKTSNLFIRNSHLSKVHARVWAKDGQVLLEDVGSTFGTVWNNSLLVPETPVAISEGDTVGFVINRPSYVLKNLLLKATPAPTVMLDKLFNPRVQLQFVVHHVDLGDASLVLLPVNDVTADASAELVSEGLEEVENTPDVNVQGEGSEDEAPEETRIVKEVSYVECDKTQNLSDVEYVEILERDIIDGELVTNVNDNDEEEACIFVEVPEDDNAEEGDKVEVYEQHAHDDEDDEEDDEDYNVEDGDDGDDGDDQDSSQDLEEPEVHEIIYEDDERTKGWAACHIYSQSCALPAPDSEEDDDYRFEPQLEVNSEEDDSDAESSEDSSVLSGYTIRDLLAEKHQKACWVPGEKYCVGEYFDPNEDSSCEYAQCCLGYWEFDSDLSEEVTPSSSSEAEQVNSNLTNDETESEEESDVLEIRAPAVWVAQTHSKKRSHDEAELEEEEEDATPQPKKSKPSTVRTVLKEVGKGLVYITGTLLALAAYGNHLESQ